MAERKTRLNRRIAIPVVVVVALAATALVGFLAPRLIQQLQEQKAKDLETKQAESLDLRLQGKTDEAKQKIEAALQDGSLSDEQKYRLHMEEGSIYSDKGDYQKAAESYEKARALQETFEVVEVLALTYRTLGNKEKAIEYYKKAITLLDKESPVYDANKEKFENYIRQLGGTP